MISSNPHYLLSVDNGGTYIKAAILDERGNQLAQVRERNQVLAYQNGYSEYDQKTLWEINCRCIRGVIEKSGVDPSTIACIGFAAQGCGFYAIDPDGNDIRNAISSADNRAQDYVRRWESDGTAERLYPKIFRHSSSGHLNAILAWLKDNEPENYARIGYLFSMKDLLIYRMTGKPVASMGCLSVSGLMDLTTQRFDRELCAMQGIPEMADKFGPLYWDGEICGYVSPTAAAACGLSEGTPVIAGHHDVLAAAMSMGVLTSEQLFIITGTCAINAYASPTPILNGTVRYNELYAFPGLYLIEEGFHASSGTLEWVIKTMFADGDLPVSEIYSRINAMVEALPPAPNQPVFLPYLRGWRDNADASGCWIGLRYEHTRAHMLRAVYEGVVFSHMLQIEHLLANRTPPAVFSLAGGATNSRVWIQIFADALNTPIEVAPGSEMGILGTAITSAVAIGVYPNLKSACQSMTGRAELVYPNPQNVPIYQEKFKTFKTLVEKLDGVWNVLH